MGLPHVSLPEGLSVGDRIVTNARYCKVYPRCKGVRRGVIVAGRHIGTEVLVHLEGNVLPQKLDYRLFTKHE